MLRFLRSIIRIPTANPPGDHYDKITRLLAAELADTGLNSRRFTVSKSLLKRCLPPDQPRLPRYNVLGTWKVGRNRPTLHFNAHYDVVPAGGSWRAGGAYSGAVSRGWIYGRGTADMKGSIASLLWALRAIRAAGKTPRVNVEVSFTADEETDSVLGTGWLVEHAPIKPDYAVVMEGGEGGSVCCGHNGVVWLKVTVHGRAAHGSQPETGINALEKMAELVVALDQYKSHLARRPFRTPEGRTMFPTINVGGVFESGPGGKINTVPALASFTIDRRVLAVENHAQAERELRHFLDTAARRIGKCRITVEKISENFACFVPPTHRFFGVMARAIREVRGEKAVFNVSSGFNDMYFFASVLKIPTVGYGPGGENYHGANERAPIRDLLTTAKVYAHLLENFAG